MANGIPTDPPNSRTIDFGALVRKTLGDEYHKHEKVYQFSDGRKFESSDYGTHGFYGGTTAIVRSGTAQDGGASFITLATSANGSPADYQSKVISAVDFATTTQTSRVVDFNVTSKVARVVPPWASNFVLHTGTAQGAGQAVMTLATSAPSALSGTLSITGGAGTWTGGTQAREILAYNGTTKVANVARWDAPYLVGTGNSDEGAQATLYLDFTDLGAGAVNTTPAFGTVSPTFTRATTATTIGSDGLVLKGIASGVARAYYDPTTLTYLGYLAEGARTNVTIQSEDFSTSWAASEVTVDTNVAVAPDGATTADKSEETTANSIHRLQIANTIGTGATTASVWAKQAERTRFRIIINNATDGNVGFVVFDVSTGTVVAETAGTGTIKAYPNGWYRCTATATTTAANSTTNLDLIESGTTGSYVGVLGSGMYFWGAQTELGTFASSYIPTTTAAVTRNADVLTYPTTGWLNASAGTIFSQQQVVGVSGQQRSVEIDDNTANERILQQISAGGAQYVVTDGGVAQTSLTPAFTATVNTTYRQAFAYMVNDFAACINGGTVSTDASGTIPTVTTLRIATDAGSISQLFGPIRRVAYFPQRLLNTTLQFITANGLTFSPSTFPRALPDSTTTYLAEKVGPGVNTTYTISA